MDERGLNERGLVERGDRGRWVVWVLGVLGVVVPIGFARATGHVWEDFLITFRHSENWIGGVGLTYNVGTRVHGFTSPLGVLLPGVFQWMSGGPWSGYGAALEMFRWMSAAAFSVAMVLVYRAVRGEVGGGGWGAIVAGAVAALLVVTDPKSIDFSINGQETALMLMWVAWGVWLSRRPVSEVWRWWAVVIAGLQWTRPDGVAFWGVLLAGNWVFGLEPRRRAGVAMGKAVGLGLAMYLPWVAWATWYYGSPVPHTIIAKIYRHSVGTSASGLAKVVGFYPERGYQVFGPMYDPAGPWPMHVKVVCWMLAGLSVGAVVIPGVPRLGRLASGCFVVMLGYFATMNLAYPWYLPPVALLGFVAVGTMGGKAAKAGRAVAAAVGVVGLVLVVERAVFLEEAKGQVALQQRVIEDEGRKQIGLWLREHVGPGEAVYLEPLGYIGYYSRARMLDYPGLVAPEVTEVIKRYGGGMETPAEVLKPKWVVLRALEANALLKVKPEFFQRYENVVVFDHLQEIQGSGVWGRRLLENDAGFIVFRRKD